MQNISEIIGFVDTDPNIIELAQAVLFLRDCVKR